MRCYLLFLFYFHWEINASAHFSTHSSRILSLLRFGQWTPEGGERETKTEKGGKGKEE